MERIRVARPEKFGDKNVRFLGYKLLQPVRYKHEPVVPEILGEGVNHDLGRHFKVEHIPGVDLEDIYFMDEINVVEKLEIVDHVVGQLQAIDKSGVILFDRAGRNIRVSSWGRNGISTRQVDIEEYFDKKFDALYIESSSSNTYKRITGHIDNGFNGWNAAVTDLRSEVALILGYHNIYDYKLFLSKYQTLWWSHDHPLARTDILSLFREDMARVIAIERFKL